MSFCRRLWWPSMYPVNLCVTKANMYVHSSIQIIQKHHNRISIHIPHNCHRPPQAALHGFINHHHCPSNIQMKKRFMRTEQTLTTIILQRVEVHIYIYPYLLNENPVAPVESNSFATFITTINNCLNLVEVLISSQAFTMTLIFSCNDAVFVCRQERNIFQIK